MTTSAKGNGGSAAASRRFDGHAALVTGGGTGIGLAVAHALAAEGCQVAIAGRRRAVLEDAAADLNRQGGEGKVCTAVAGDVANPAGARHLVDEAVRRLGGLDILVNCAGVYRSGPLADCSEDDLGLVIDVDLKGALYAARAAIPHLRSAGGTAAKEASEASSATADSSAAGAGANGPAGGGSIVNISSSLTLSPLPNCAVYTAAKAGLDAATRSLAAELAGDRIRVNAVLPGVVRTPIFETVMAPGDAAAFLDGFGDRAPLGRVGEPGDVARAVAFLCDPANDWITGALLAVDGGLSLGTA